MYITTYYVYSNRSYDTLGKLHRASGPSLSWKLFCSASCFPQLHQEPGRQGFVRWNKSATSNLDCPTCWGEERILANSREILEKWMSTAASSANASRHSSEKTKKNSSEGETGKGTTLRRPRNWSSFMWACDRSGEAVTAHCTHRKFQIISWSYAQINSNQHRPVQPRWHVYRQSCPSTFPDSRFDFPKSLGRDGEGKRLTDAEFEKFKARSQSIWSPGLSKMLCWFPSNRWAFSTWFSTCHPRISKNDILLKQMPDSEASCGAWK